MATPRTMIVTLTDDPLDPPGASRYGGAQKFVFDLGRHLVRDGHEVIYVTRKSRVDKPLYQELGPLCRIYRIDLGPEHEVNHHRLWETALNFRLAVKEIADKEEGVTGVLSYNWISGLAAKETGIDPFVHHILSLGRSRLALGEETSPSDQARDAGEIEVFKAATYLVCVCQDELTSLTNLYPEIDPEKVVIIPYGVDSNAYQRRPLSTDSYLRWAGQRFKEGH